MNRIHRSAAHPRPGLSLMFALLCMYCPAVFAADSADDPHAQHRAAASSTSAPAEPAAIPDPQATHVHPAPPEPDGPAALPVDPHAGHGAANSAPAPVAADHSGHTGTTAAPAVMASGARDPHAYSGGYVLGSGLYAIPEGHMLHMAEHAYSWAVVMDRLEAVDTADGSTSSFEMNAWYGRDFKRLWLRSEGELDSTHVEESSTELLYGQAIRSYWDGTAGLRVDTSAHGTRSWLGAGIKGLAPYWFEVNTAVWLGEGGQTALVLEAEYELLLTQRLVLQPRVEVSLYGRDEARYGIGQGLSEAVLGLRLRYEFSRQIAPYVGVERTQHMGDSAGFIRQQGGTTRETRYLAGLRFWF